MAGSKQRLDTALVEKGLCPSRERARAVILAGKVFVDGSRVTKAGTGIGPGAVVDVRGDPNPYASRGGLKLEAALESFAVAVAGKTCMDIGASTGGFTDCLIQAGAAHVFAVDVGYGQLAWHLRRDSRVTVIERTNIRHMPLNAIAAPVDLVTVDVSFISLKIVVPAALKFMTSEGDLVVLIKPQFEVGKEHVGKGGIVRDPALHNRVLRDLGLFFGTVGLAEQGWIPSPLPGSKGNREFLMHLRRSGLR